MLNLIYGSCIHIDIVGHIYILHLLVEPKTITLHPTNASQGSNNNTNLAVLQCIHCSLLEEILYPRVY